MKLTQKITLALGVLAAVSASQAQTPAATTPTAAASTGLLGTQYTELSFELTDIKHISDHGYSLGAAANTALIPGVLDGGGFYSYSWVRGPFKGHANTIGGYTTAYTALADVKPFAGVGLGYQWTSTSFGSDDRALWGATAGVEIPVGAVTITPRINYADDFESGESTQEWTFQVEANYWFNATTAVFGAVGKTDVRRSPFDAWNYTVGLRAKF